MKKGDCRHNNFPDFLFLLYTWIHGLKTIFYEKFTVIHVKIKNMNDRELTVNFQ